MQLILHATRRTHDVTSRLVMECEPGPARTSHAPSRLCRDSRSMVWRLWHLQQVPTRWIVSSFQYPQVPSIWIVSVSGTREYGADGSFWLLVPTFKPQASFRRCGHSDEVGADSPLIIIHWFRLFLAKVRVRVRVRVTSPSFATPGSMKCAVQVWSERWTVVKCAAQTWSKRSPGRDNARAVFLWCRRLPCRYGRIDEVMLGT